MIILIDTSTNQCQLTIVDDNKQHHFSQDLGRGLARFLLKFIEDSLVSLESDVTQPQTSASTRFFPSFMRFPPCAPA